MVRVYLFLIVFLSQSVFAEQDSKLFESLQKSIKIVVIDANDEGYKYWDYYAVNIQKYEVVATLKKLEVLTQGASIINKRSDSFILAHEPVKFARLKVPSGGDLSLSLNLERIPRVGEHDEKAIYHPPFYPSANVTVSQSYNPKFDLAKDITHLEQNKYAVDFATDAGEKILVSRKGRVIYVKNDSDKSCFDKREHCVDDANEIWIKHEDGTLGLYSHLIKGSAAVKVGDFVEQGAELGKVGCTGYCSGPHLHFEVLEYKNGVLSSAPFALYTSNGERIYLLEFTSLYHPSIKDVLKNPLRIFEFFIKKFILPD